MISLPKIFYVTHYNNKLIAQCAKRMHIIRTLFVLYSIHENVKLCHKFLLCLSFSPRLLSTWTVYRRRSPLFQELICTFIFLIFFIWCFMFYKIHPHYIPLLNSIWHYFCFIFILVSSAFETLNVQVFNETSFSISLTGQVQNCIMFMFFQ